MGPRGKRYYTLILAKRPRSDNLAWPPRFLAGAVAGSHDWSPAVRELGVATVDLDPRTKSCEKACRRFASAAPRRRWRPTGAWRPIDPHRPWCGSCHAASGGRPRPGPSRPPQTMAWQPRRGRTSRLSRWLTEAQNRYYPLDGSQKAAEKRSMWTGPS